jgi:hypothetical protein
MAAPNKAYIEARMKYYIEQLDKLEKRPVDQFEEGAIVTFQKGFGRSFMYTYAAVKAGGKWWMSGLRRPSGSMSWDSLMEFIEEGETETPVIRYMTDWAVL